jgi:hypothetical protein
MVPLGCIRLVEKAYRALTLCLSSKILVPTPCVFECRLAAVSIMAMVELQTRNDRFMEYSGGM